MANTSANLLDQLGHALSKAARAFVTEPNPYWSDHQNEENAARQQRELENTAKPSGWGDVEARAQRLANEAEQLVEERSRLLALGQEASGLQNRVIGLERQLADGLSEIAITEERVAEANRNAKLLFGDKMHPHACYDWIINAHNWKHAVAEMKTFARDLEAELTEARKELQAFRAKHGISE